MASKILLHNFDYSLWSLGEKFIQYGDYEEIAYAESRKKPNRNTRIIVKESNNRSQAITNIVAALLIHDKLVVNVRNFLYILEFLGYQDTLLLLENGVFEIVDDGNYNPMLSRRGNNTWQMMYVSSLDTAINNQAVLEGFESRLKTRFSRRLGRRELHQGEISKIQLLVEKHRVEIENNIVIKKITAELKYDLNNENLKQSFGIASSNFENIIDGDIYSILRLASLNMGLAHLSHIKADSILVEGKVREALQSKISPISKSAIDSSTEMFKTVITQKGIPDLGYLYINKIISINEIIKFRNDFNGRLFREWLKSTDYNQEEITEVLLNKKGGILDGNISQFLRWIIPEVIELINPLVGLTASVVDSFVLEKVLNGWHPSFFLDNKLAKKMSENNNEFVRTQRRKRVLELYPKTGPNDRCPCGSGKKFKKCCG